MKPELCRCGHDKDKHHHGKSCLAIVNDERGVFCHCSLYRPKKEKTSGVGQIPQSRSAAPNS